MAAPSNARTQEAPREIVPLEREAALAIALPENTRFTSYQLAQHVTDFPDLAYRVLGSAQYIVGGLWRRRQECGAVLEMITRTEGQALLRRLIEAYRRRGCVIVVVDPYEQERNPAVYRQSQFRVVETLIQMERRGLDVAAPPQTVAIRAMQEKDIPQVLEVERHSFPWLWWNSEAELLWYAGISGVRLYVALAADNPDRVVGYAGFTMFERQAHLDRLAVHRDYQGQGYGTALLTFSMRRMAQRGARRVALTTQVDNRRSQVLYKRFGFRESGWRQDLYGLWLRQPPEGPERDLG